LAGATARKWEAISSELRYGDHDKLEELVESASLVTNRRLIHVLQVSSGQSVVDSPVVGVFNSR
jgi:hypothetical protein